MMRVLYPTGADAAMWQTCADEAALDITLTPAYARVQEIATGGIAICLLYRWHGQFVMLPGLLHENSAGYDMASFFGGGGAARFGSLRWEPIDQAFTEWRKGAKVVCEYAQIRLGSLLPPMPPPHSREVRGAVMVDLVDMDDTLLLESFSRNRQRAIRDIDIDCARVPATREFLYHFHTLYEQSMRRLKAAKRWCYPQRAWGAYARELRDERVMLVAAPAGHAEAMLLVTFAYGKAHALFMASSERGQAMHSTLYWRAMCLARDAGCSVFYLGGGRTNEPDDALLQFKLSFSKHTVPVYEYKRIYDEAAYAKLAQGCTSSFFPPWRGA